MPTTIQINERGNLTLPKAMRKALGIDKGGVMIAILSADGVVLKPAMSFPIEIYTSERVAEFDNADEELRRHLKRKAKC